MKLYEKESKRTVVSRENRGRLTVTSYREELTLREPGRVDARYLGGAYGCPGDYFRGARAEECRKPDRARCRACWDGDYRDEEWMDDEEQ